MAIPARVASRGEAKETGWPPTRICPSKSWINPEAIFINVLFPAPFSPIRAWTSPDLNWKSTSRSTCVGPKDFEIRSISSANGSLGWLMRSTEDIAKLGTLTASTFWLRSLVLHSFSNGGSSGEGGVTCGESYGGHRKRDDSGRFLIDTRQH